jgi:glycosyltransferase involved in cell wall biosynthesis
VALRSGGRRRASRAREWQAVLSRVRAWAAAGEEVREQWAGVLVDAVMGLLERGIVSPACDVVVAPASSSAEDLLLVEAARLARVPVVLEACGLTDAFAPWQVQGASALVAHSEHARWEVLRAWRLAAPAWPLPARLLALPLGVDVERFRPCSQTAPATPLAVVVGRVSPEKGVHLAVRAALRLPAPARLLVVGAGPSLQPERQAAADLRATNVFFAGARPHAHLPELLCSAKAFVFPALRPRTETLGLAPLEALAAGLPVVAFVAGGSTQFLRSFRPAERAAVLQSLAEHASQPFRDALARDRIRVLEHALLVREPADSDALALALQALLFAPDSLWLRMSHNARAVAMTHFDVRNTSRRFERLWRSVARSDT